MKHELSLELYFLGSIEYNPSISKLLASIDKLVLKFGIDFKDIDCSNLSESEMSKIGERIRAIIPQKRGSIVTSKGDILPLSGNRKKLNMQNTPILLVRKRSIGDVYVFPCRVAETYYTILDGVTYLYQNLPDLPELVGKTEKEIISMILANPELIEPGLQENAQTEVETGAGTIDIVFLDSSSNALLVEAERQADDAPLGQILRLCAAYAKSHPAAGVRGMIACLRAREFVKDAAKRAGIEVKIVKEREEE